MTMIPRRLRSWLDLRFSEGDRVVATLGDLKLPGHVDQVNDTDQGDFEYHVTHDDGSGSFWAREDLDYE